MNTLPKVALAIVCSLQLAEAALLSAEPQRPAGLREEVPITTGWGFQIDVADLGQKERWFDGSFDRLGWAKVKVPKAWDLYDQALWGYEGIGWYAASIEGTLVRTGKVQTLHFGRVNYHTKVWLNGELLGENIGGYLPFEFSVTGKLKKSSPNLLVLRVDNRPRLEWLPAAKEIEWMQYGGILGPVVLVTTPVTYIVDLSINAVPRGEKASITCVVKVLNSGNTNQELMLRVGVAGHAGSKLATPFIASAGATSIREVQLSLEHAPLRLEEPSAHGRTPPCSSRSYRRETLPTSVLGSSPRNSISLGTL